MKPGIWASDWFAGLAFTLVFVILAYAVLSASFQGLERSAYDLGVRLRSEAPSDRVAVIAIDDQSIQNLGRWPWPRSLHAAMLQRLQEGGAKAVGSTVFFFEDQTDPGLIFLDELTEMFAASSLVEQAPMELLRLDSPLLPLYEADLEAIASKLVEAHETLSMDQALGAAMTSSGNVGLAMTFALGRPTGRPDRPLPDYVRRARLNNIVDRVEAQSHGWMPLPTVGALYPIPALGEAAGFMGHLNTLPDVDGANRFEALVLRHYDEYYPSLTLMLVAQALNLEPGDIEVRLGEGVALGGLEISTTSDLRMYTHFYQNDQGRPPFAVDSFFDVFTGSVPASKYRDKIVLIGASAVGVGDSFPTPVAPSMAPVEAMAHVVSSILNEDFYVRPQWARWAELGALAVAALYVAFLLPLLGPALGALFSVVLVLSLFGTQLFLMVDMGLWLKLVIPALLIVFGHLFMTIKRLRLTERLKVSSELEGAESNRMLGLAFQGQGQLDMAFEKFRRVKPVDEKVLDLLYNLALDYERKRQFNKAESVYQYIAQHNAKFRDVAAKLARAKKLSDTIILGSGGGAATATGTLITAGDVEKPMLGRYEVQKELGKGAMGVVYLGKDPKIGRQVAIKTMALAQEFEADELAEVKSRFFREAETAGRLSHPNIVSIFDAGEEHDLAFIAMEFIEGHDLVRYTKPANLMPVRDVLKIIADAADALDYAHAQNIVHRDIKPANLMWLTDRSIVKVTDFGIARITDSSKTKTGMVLGTPSFMSPEQLAGKKVDGRSDLFSLGVTLYQMLTGALPFQADSMATLMFKIANEPHASPSTLRPDLLPEVDRIVDKSMNKDPDQRYQRGSEMARDLRAVLAATA